MLNSPDTKESNLSFNLFHCGVYLEGKQVNTILVREYRRGNKNVQSENTEGAIKTDNQRHRQLRVHT